MRTTRVHRVIAGLGLTAFVGLALTTTMAAPAAATEAGVLGAGSPNAIKDSYLVVYRDGVKERDGGLTRDLATRHQVTVKHSFRAAVRGFAGTMSEAEAKRLAADPAVAYVEQDRQVTALDTQINPPSWGLDRTDQRALPLNSSYTYPTAAYGVTAYILDSGIRTTHVDFGGRAVWGVNTTGDGNNSDCNGHGTHVAGTVGGSTLGIAKGVRLVAVKVLDCLGNGSLSGITAGIDWVTANAVRPAVANMSLGAVGISPTMENAVRTSIASGITYAIASGNSTMDACGYTPARTPEAITVNATTRTDVRASFSDYGACTDIFAPGDGIVSAYHTSDTAAAMASGTSMAAPHVAGVAALVLAAYPTATPAQVAEWLYANATSGVVGDTLGSPNRLLYLAPMGCAPVTNGTDVAIPDLSTVESQITVSGCLGNASASSRVEVHIVHTWVGDLIVDLIAPDGTVYPLRYRTGGSADDIHDTYTVNLAGELTNGVWRLRVQDAAGADIGRIDSWTLDV